MYDAPDISQKTLLLFFELLPVSDITGNQNSVKNFEEPEISTLSTAFDLFFYASSNVRKRNYSL